MKALKLFAIATAIAAMQPSVHAAIVNNNLSGNVEYDGWSPLTAAVPGLTSATLQSGFGSNEAGSGDAVLKRTSGTHFPSSSSLYAFAGNSTFEVADASALADVKTVVFTIQTWPNPEFGDGSTAASAINAGPTLNFNGGSQALPANLTSALNLGPLSGGGFDVETFAYTFQWDLSSEAAAITSYDVDWGQIVHTGVLAIQLESADVFTVSAAIVPEPATLALGALSGVALLAVRRRRAS